MTQDRRARSGGLRAAVDAAAERLVAAGESPGAVAGVMTAEGETLIAAAGCADAASGGEMTTGSLFRIASITKVITVMGIMQLRDEGRLRLDDPLVAHLPEFAAAVNPFGPLEDVTIRRLLTHESGLQCEHPIEGPLAPCWLPREELLARLDRVRVVIPPSSAHKYSNLGFDLLGEVLARTDRTDWERAVSRRLLAPLGMTSTMVDPRRTLQTRTTRGHVPLAAGESETAGFAVCETATDGTMPGSGALWSSAGDLLRLAASVLDGLAGMQTSPAGRETLCRSTLLEMLDCRICCGETTPLLQGLGWYAERDEAGAWWPGHAGLLEGYSSALLLSPAHRVAVVVLANSAANAARSALELGRVVTRHRTPAPLELGSRGTSSAPPAPPAVAADLIGRYEHASFGSEVEVSWVSAGGDAAGGAGLMLIDEDGAAYPLEPTEDALVWTVRGGRASGEAAWFVGGGSHPAAVNIAGFLYERRR